MQFSFRKIVLGSLAACALTVPAMAEIKVGVVDYARLFEESPQAKVVRETLQAEFGPRLQQLVTQENALKARGEKLQKDVVTMTPEQRGKAEKDLRDAARELERKKGELQDDSNVKRQEEMNKLQRSLIGEVREYAKAQNLRHRDRRGRDLCDAHGRHHGAGVGGPELARAEAGRGASRFSGTGEAAHQAIGSTGEAPVRRSP